MYIDVGFFLLLQSVNCITWYIIHNGGTTFILFVVVVFVLVSLKYISLLLLEIIENSIRAIVVIKPRIFLRREVEIL